MKKIFSLILVTIFLFTGCASIVSKSTYPVNINSQPQKADIIIINRLNRTVFTGKTPTIVMLKTKAGYFKGERYTVTFKKEGYVTYVAKIKCGLDVWYVAGNFVFGGLIGYLIVDPATGAMWSLKDLHVNLDNN